MSFTRKYLFWLLVPPLLVSVIPSLLFVLQTVQLSTGTSFSGSDRNDFTLFNSRSMDVRLSWQLFNGFVRERDVA